MDNHAPHTNDKASPRAGLVSRMFDAITKPPVLTWFAALQAAALSVVALRYHTTLKGATGPTGEVATGDFLAFYTGALALRKGQGTRLYDMDTQHRIQRDVVGRQLTTWQPYFNPPLLALGVATLAGDSFLSAFRLFAAVMVACCLGAVVLLRWAVPRLCSRRVAWITMMLVVIGYHPILRTMVGGQNTPLTLLLIVGFCAMLRQERPIPAGLFLGGLSYKPQYGLLPAVFIALHREWRALIAAAAVWALHYAVAAIWCGTSWPLALGRTLLETRKWEWTANLRTHFSLVPVLAVLFPRPWAQIAALLMSALVLAVLVYGVRRSPQRPSPASLLGLAIAAAMITSPHLQYYEAGLMVVPALLGLEDQLERGIQPPLATRALLALGYLGFPLYGLARQLHFQPLFLCLAGLFLWMLRALTARRSLAGA